MKIHLGDLRLSSPAFNMDEQIPQSYADSQKPFAMILMRLSPMGLHTGSCMGYQLRLAAWPRGCRRTPIHLEAMDTVWRDIWPQRRHRVMGRTTTSSPCMPWMRQCSWNQG
jgi:hypothetical protein